MITYKSENRIQQECVMWFHNTYPNLRGLLFSVPNGGNRSPMEGKLLKLTGVIPGVSDLILLYNSKAYCIELKNSLGKQSQAQKNWQAKVKAQGFNYYLLRDLEVFKEVIKNILDEVTN